MNNELKSMKLDDSDLEKVAGGEWAIDYDEPMGNCVDCKKPIYYYPKTWGYKYEETQTDLLCEDCLKKYKQMEDMLDWGKD